MTEQIFGTMCNATTNFSDVKHTSLSSNKLNAELLVSLLPVTIFIGLEALLGLIGNTLILCVYTKLYLHCNFRYFVLSLAIYDITSCVTTLPGEMFSEFNWYNYKYDWHCKLKSYFNVFTVWGSAFTLLLLGYDRYRKICQPLNWQIRPSLALKLCVGGMILSAAVSVPASILWGIQEYIYNADGMCVTVSICEKSGMYVNDAYPLIYITSVYVLPVGIMMIAICVWNVLIARKLFCPKLGIRSTSNPTVTEMPTCAITRNTSESSDIAQCSAVHVGIRRMLCFKSSVRENREERPDRSKQRRRSFTSVSFFIMTDLPTRDKIDITSDNDDAQSSTQNHDCGSFRDEDLARQDSNNSVSSESNTAMDRLVSHDNRSDGTIVRRKRKTLIMLILTSVFIITLTIYIILVSLVAEKHGILRKLSNTEKTVFFFFMRINFVNCVINPVLYGIMDPRFRTGLKTLLCSCRFTFKH